MTQFLPRQQDQHFLVTGAGTGIGRAIAIRLASEGAKLSLVGRTTATLEETADQIDALGGSAQVLAADVGDRDHISAAVDAAAEWQGPFRGVIANAGVGGPNSPGPDDRFDELIQTNLIGTYSTLRAVQEHLAPEGLRHMVVVSSCLARFGVPHYTGYCASKTGLLGLTKSLSLELAGDKVQVNAICPGWVDTQMARDGIQGMADAMGKTYDEAFAMAMSAVPAGRMSTPDEIAGMTAWLVSADGVGMTGQGLDMNGGSWMG
jgi:NAD(P)-dependent dehydrogenase (short-subunit alcohol dehydrogenase family)